MTNFNEFGLSAALNESLQRMNYTAPTPIQAQSIPIALQGRDILGSAQTGTGKTAAFSIPLVESLLRSPLGTAIVLTPTRELAKQVLDVIRQLLGPKSQIKTAFIIGGDPIGKQFQQLKQSPRIIVGTPGRVNDHLDRGSINLTQCGFLVLDETDRMLDMGFGIQLDAIVKHLPKERQTLMFSATLPQSIVKLSNKYLNNPQRVSVGETNVIAKNIKQDVVRIEQPEKYAEMLNQLHERVGSVIVFAKTKHGCDKLAKRLKQDGFEADALHGDLRQQKRDKVMRRFREKKFRVLVATDIAARGLDVPHIEHVINYDLPQVAEDYIHRMGRTARAGSSGAALSFVASQDSRKWHAIEKLLGIAPQRTANEGARKKNVPKNKSRWDKKKKKGFAEKSVERNWNERSQKSKKREDYKKTEGFKKRVEKEANYNTEQAHAQTSSQQRSQKPRHRHFDEQRSSSKRKNTDGQTRFKKGTVTKKSPSGGKPKQKRAA